MKQNQVAFAATLFAILVLKKVEAVGDEGSCLDKNGVASDYRVGEGLPDWPVKYDVTIHTLDTCWYFADQSTYVTWPTNEMVTVTSTEYGFDETYPDLCAKQDGAEVVYYEKNKNLYSYRTPWPFNNDNVCANYIRVRNDDEDRNSTVTFYTFPKNF